LAKPANSITGSEGGKEAKTANSTAGPGEEVQVDFCVGKLDPRPEKLFDALRRLWSGNVTAINPLTQRHLRHTQ
jgi:hypothetical protein